MICLSAFVGSWTKMFLCKTRGPGSLPLPCRFQSLRLGRRMGQTGGFVEGVQLSGVEENDARRGGCDRANGGKLTEGCDVKAGGGR